MQTPGLVKLLWAVNTIDAPRWKRWAARLFGERIVSTDRYTAVIAYRWRGKTYFHDFTETKK